MNMVAKLVVGLVSLALSYGWLRFLAWVVGRGR